MAEIDYDKFKNTLKRLEEGYKDYLEQEESKAGAKIMQAFKESCIQRFEICVDTSWKHIKKYMQDNLGATDIANSPNPIFKKAAENKILDAEIWIEFNKKRGDTSHDYCGDKADETFAIIGDFILEAIAVYETIAETKWQN